MVGPICTRLADVRGACSTGGVPYKLESLRTHFRRGVISISFLDVPIRKRGSGSNASRLRQEAPVQVSRGWLCGPQKYTSRGELTMAGKATAVNPACRLGAQQSDKLRAVGDLKRSLTNEATAVQTQINLRSWGHPALMCVLFR